MPSFATSTSRSRSGSAERRPCGSAAASRSARTCAPGTAPRTAGSGRGTRVRDERVAADERRRRAAARRRAAGRRPPWARGLPAPSDPAMSPNESSSIEPSTASTEKCAGRQRRRLLESRSERCDESLSTSAWIVATPCTIWPSPRKTARGCSTPASPASASSELVLTSADDARLLARLALGPWPAPRARARAPRRARARPRGRGSCRAAAPRRSRSARAGTGRWRRG